MSDGDTSVVPYEAESHGRRQPVQDGCSHRASHRAPTKQLGKVPLECTVAFNSHGSATPCVDERDAAQPGVVKR